ncbi:MAG: hypothetical protein DRJ38_00825 [Thermoprotei archaeon]|nr:MAG: hypothetical protein DRJ38_00825 [Thermoprotei archaeon]
MIFKRTAEKLRKLGYIVKIDEEIIGVSGVSHKIPFLIENPQNGSKICIHLDDGSSEIILLKLFSIYVDTGIRQILLSDKKNMFKGVEVINIKSVPELLDVIVDRLETSNKQKNILTKTY